MNITPLPDSSFLFAISFNLYDILLATTFLLSVVVAAPLLINENHKRHNALLAVFILVQGVYALYAVLLYSQTIGQYTHANLAPFQYVPVLALRGIQGAVLLLIAKLMTNQRIMVQSGIVCVSLVITLTLCAANAISVAIYSYNVIALVSEWLLYVVSAVFGVKAYREVVRYQSTLSMVHSNFSGRKLQWLQLSCALFTVIWSSRAVALVLETTQLRDIAEFVFTFSQMPVLFLIGALAVYSQTHTTGFSKLFAELAKPSTENEYNGANEQLRQRLNYLMTTANMYQDPELRLDDLADRVNVSPRTLTTLLNQYCGNSFYEYVNSYRVQHAQHQLSQPQYKKKSIQRIFEDAGFSSKSTFYSLFKQQVGMTPSAYRKTYMDNEGND